jgi:hypothetical protein
MTCRDVFNCIEVMVMFCGQKVSTFYQFYVEQLPVSFKVLGLLFVLRHLYPRCYISGKYFLTFVVDISLPFMSLFAYVRNLLLRLWAY